MIKRWIRTAVVTNILNKNYDLALQEIQQVLTEPYVNIPSTKRASYGRVYTIQVLGEYLFSTLEEMHVPIFEIGATMLSWSEDYRSKGVALTLLSLSGIDDYAKVLPIFESAASSEDWNIREFAQMLFRKLIQKHPQEVRGYLLKLTTSESSNIRRFVSETLRPVKENRWFYKDPEYPLSILRHLFKERATYPRTSIGNNLSDLARHLPDRVFTIVEDLVRSGDHNAYWIAYRACRNLVKKEPIRVLDLLEVDEYRYKKKVYRRRDYSRD